MTARLVRLTQTALLRLMACAALIAGGGAIVTTADAAPAAIRLTGTVSDRAGYPLAGVNVVVVRADHEDSDFTSTTTDWAGRFVTPKIPVGSSVKYKLQVNDPTGHHQAGYSTGVRRHGSQQEPGRQAGEGGHHPWQGHHQER